MSKQTINIGASPNDGTGTPLRTSFDYTNQNFTELYTALGGGVGLPGATTQVIFNDGGTNLAGDAGLVYNKTTDALTVAGLVTAGSATITGALTVDTTTLVVNAAGYADRVGIGTATPVAELHVIGGANFSDGTTTLRAVSSGNVAFLGTTTTDPLVLRVNSIEQYRIAQLGVFTWSDGAISTRMTLNSTGLGIGASPSYKLDVQGSGIRLNSGSATGFAILRLGGTASDSFFGFAGNANDIVTGSSAGDTVIGSNKAGANLRFISGNGVLNATLDASGNLLVASGVVRAAGRTEIGSGYIGDISGTGNNRGIFLGSTGIFPADGSGNSSDNTYDLGSATARWDTVFAGTGTINTSDRNEKQDISDLSASEKRVASSIKQLVKKYRFKDAVASKGENARIHVGWIAQDIQSAFAAEGLDASDYGMFCSDTWEENGVEKTRLGLRYDEVLAFVVSTI